MILIIIPVYYIAHVFSFFMYHLMFILYVIVFSIILCFVTLLLEEIKNTYLPKLYLLRLIVPLVSFGTPWPNKQNHKTLHFQIFLNEKFNAASIKITVFKIKSHFTEYSSVILSLSIILTEILYFLKFSNKCKFYKNIKKFAYFQHAFYIQ